MGLRRLSSDGEWGEAVEWNAGDDGCFGLEVGAAGEEVKRWLGVIGNVLGLFWYLRKKDCPCLKPSV